MRSQRLAYTSVFAFVIALLFNACKKDQHNPSAGIAHGSTQSTGEGACLPSNVNGKWYIGIPGDSSNYVDVTVNVSKPGTYRIGTNTVDGVSLTDSGTFTATGLYGIRLHPSGKFSTAGPHTFSVTFDSSSCDFTMTVLDSTGRNTPVGVWQFTLGGKVYTGSGQAFQYPVAGSTAASVLNIEGRLPSNTFDSALHIGIGLSVTFPNVPVGTWKTNTSWDNVFTFGRNTGGQHNIWYADPSSWGAVMTVVISGYDPETRVITGRFGGTVLDSAKHVIPLNDGIFRIKNL